MGGLTKALVIEAGIVLLLVIADVFALGYFKIVDFSILFNKPHVISAKPATSATPTSSSLTELTSKESKQLPIKRLLNEKKELETLRRTKTFVLAKNLIAYNGKIKELTIVDKVASPQSFKIRIVIAIGNGGDTMSYNLPEADVSKAEVSDANGKRINLSDLKIGDMVVVTVSRTLDYDTKDNLQRIFINKKN